MAMKSEEPESIMMIKEMGYYPIPLLDGTESKVPCLLDESSRQTPWLRHILTLPLGYRLAITTIAQASFRFWTVTTQYVWSYPCGSRTASITLS